MNSFRERFGCDWLQYRSHLETSGIPALAPSKAPALNTLPPDALSPEATPDPLPAEKEALPEMAEEVRVPLEPQEEEEMEEQGKEEEEQEQNEVEGVCAVAEGSWAGGGGMSGSIRKTQLGVADPFWMEGCPTVRQCLGYLSLLTGSLHWSLLSGALPPHIGVSTGRARGHAGQGALSSGHF